MMPVSRMLRQRVSGLAGDTRAALRALWLLARSRPGLRRGRRILDAYLYALPLVEVARLRWRSLQGAGGQRLAVNRFVHQERLSGHLDRLVTTPNNDTLYSLAVLDLSGGPLLLEVPDTGGRYYSLALIDAASNNFAIVGRRTTGTAAGRFLVGQSPVSAAAAAAVPIIAPGPSVLALLRILVDDEADVPAVRALQQGFRLSTPAGTTPVPVADPVLALTALPDESDAVAFVQMASAVLAANPPPPADAAVLRRLRGTGLGGDDTLAADAAALADWQAVYPLARDILRQAITRLGRASAGWRRPPAHIGDFGGDYRLRAGVALAGLLALPPVEAAYASTLSDSRGRPLAGGACYRLRFPAGGLPVHAFWSLSLYEVMPDGRLFFIASELGRHAIGDRTPGLRHAADGALEIDISHEPPVAGTANWLPAPARGPFCLILRTYQPDTALLDSRYRLPDVERVAR